MNLNCEQFRRNPSVNPYTGLLFTINDPTYNKLVNECKSYSQNMNQIPPISPQRLALIPKPVISPPLSPIISPQIIYPQIIYPQLTPIPQPIISPQIKPISPQIKPIISPQINPIPQPIISPQIKPIPQPIISPRIVPIPQPISPQIKPISQPISQRIQPIPQIAPIPKVVLSPQITQIPRPIISSPSIISKPNIIQPNIIQPTIPNVTKPNIIQPTIPNVTNPNIIQPTIPNVTIPNIIQPTIPNVTKPMISKPVRIESPKQNIANQLKVLSINIEAYSCLKKNNCLEFFNEISSLNADVICTQEDLESQTHNKLRDYVLVAECQGEPIGSTILTNRIYIHKSLMKDLGKSGKINITAGCGVPRCASYVTVKSIIIVNLHLCGNDTKYENLQNVKSNEIEAVISGLNVIPDIILGGFNAEVNRNNALNSLNKYPLYQSLNTSNKNIFLQYYTSHHQTLNKYGYLPSSEYVGNSDLVYYQSNRLNPISTTNVSTLNYTNHNGILVDFFIKQ